MGISNPLIEIVIPHWNGYEMLEVCLRSLEQQTHGEFLVTVVDNGSSDGSPDLIRQHFPDVKVVALSDNSGFSAAVNRGIECSSGTWIFLLNNDVEVAPDCVEKIVMAINNDGSQYDCYSVKMMSYNQREVIDGAGDAVLRGGAGYRLGTMEKDNDYYSTCREVFGACAGAAVYRRDFFTTAGKFDEDFFAYLEDVDLNMRARRRGLKFYFLAEAIVYHIGSATTGSKINPFTIKQSTKNSFHVLIKNYPFILLLKLLPVILIYQFFWFLFVVKKVQLMAYLGGVFFALRELPKMLRKRKNVLSDQANIHHTEFGRILSESENEVVLSIMSRRASAGKSNTLLTIYKKLFL